ncbi:hypothetical protein IMCC3317_23600 [Kordia antarctica]|uniref:Uncharacterized protein n=1 Tax=Kordia antarctica TaxID=1218801 RepID=A0A7L4ZKN1_9FLAO|nr:hypothetical protein IMCC3317_23600 [Kordia antarctica]
MGRKNREIQLILSCVSENEMYIQKLDLFLIIIFMKMKV